MRKSPTPASLRSTTCTRSPRNRPAPGSRGSNARGSRTRPATASDPTTPVEIEAAEPNAETAIAELDVLCGEWIAAPAAMQADAQDARSQVQVSRGQEVPADGQAKQRRLPP